MRKLKSITADPRAKACKGNANNRNYRCGWETCEKIEDECHHDDNHHDDNDDDGDDDDDDDDEDDDEDDDGDDDDDDDDGDDGDDNGHGNADNVKKAESENDTDDDGGGGDDGDDDNGSDYHEVNPGHRWWHTCYQQIYVLHGLQSNFTQVLTWHIETYSVNTLTMTPGFP